MDFRRRKSSFRDTPQFNNEDKDQQQSESYQLLKEQMHYGTDWTQHDLKSLRGTSPEEYSTLFPQMSPTATKFQDLPFASPEYEEYLEKRRIKRHLADHDGSFAGIIAQLHLNREGDKKSLTEMLETLFLHPEHFMDRTENGWDQVHQDPQHNPLFLDQSKFKDADRADKVFPFTEEFVRFDKFATQHHVIQGTEFNKKMFEKSMLESEAVKNMKAIPEIDQLALQDVEATGNPTHISKYDQNFIFGRDVHTDYPSSLFMFPLLADIASLFGFNTHDGPAARQQDKESKLTGGTGIGLRFITKETERRWAQESSDRIKQSLKDLTTEDLDDLLQFDQPPEETTYKLDVFYRQQYALLEQLVEKGVIKVPNFTTAEQEQSKNHLLNYLTQYVAPRAILFDPTKTSPDNKFFTVDYERTQSKKNMLKELHRVTEIEDEEEQKLPKAIKNSSTPSILSLDLFKWKNSDDGIQLHPAEESGGLFSTFFGESKNGMVGEDDLSALPLWDRVKLYINEAFTPPPGYWQRDAAIDDTQSDAFKNNPNYHANNHAFDNLGIDTSGKSARELAAMHMQAVNAGTYIDNVSPKGRLLGQLNHLQTLMRQPHLPPHVKGQIKAYQQQAFLAYYQLLEKEQQDKAAVIANDPHAPKPYKFHHGPMQEQFSPVKTRFDVHNPVWSSHIGPVPKPFDICDEDMNTFRVCCMDNNDNIMQCQKEYRVFKICKANQVKPAMDIFNLTPPEYQQFYSPPLRPSPVNQHVLDTTFALIE